MEPKEAIERVVIASALLATSFIPKNSEVKASYYKEDIPSCSNPLPQKESAAEQELSPEPNYCEIPRQRNDSLFADFVDWDPFFPNSTIGPQKSSEMIVENEKREITFDPQNYDFTEFANYSLKSTELLPDNSIFETVEDKIPLYLIPINYDKEIETYSSEVKQAYIDEGTNLDIAQVRVIENSDGTTAEVGVLSNTFKSRYAGVILMSITDKEGNVLNLVKKNEEIEATATAVMTEEETFPNEVINNLMAIKKIAEFQEANCFEAGKEYSYISLIGIDTYEGLSKYLVGFNNSNGDTLAGGVCVTATALSSLFHQIEGAKIENTPHRRAYPQGPYSGAPYTIDSGIETYFNDKYNVDLAQEFPKQMKELNQKINQELK